MKRISRRTKLFAPAVIGAAVAFAQPSFADTDAAETADTAAAPEKKRSKQLNMPKRTNPRPSGNELYTPPLKPLSNSATK